MFSTFLNIGLTVFAVTFCAWLSGKNPRLAGFIMAMPLATLLVLPMSQAQYHNPANSVQFAKSIFFAIPISLLFFVPFLFAEKINLGFWGCYLSGFLLLIGGYFLHRFIG